MTVQDAQVVGSGIPVMVEVGPATELAAQREPEVGLGPTPVPVIPVKRERLVSLDVFRGITIAAMMLVNNPGRGTAFAPLEHADWNGWTPTDLIFPFFLFIVGVAIPFSMSRRLVLAGGKLKMLGQVWLRALSIVLCGSLLHALPLAAMDPVPPGFGMLRVVRWAALLFTVLGIFAVLFPWKRSKHWNWIIPAIAVSLVLLLVGTHFYNKHALAAGIGESFKFGGGMLNPWRYRIPGVLQRIGVCYGVAASIALFSGWRTVLISAILLMAAYSALMLKAPFENHVTGSLTHADNLERRIDEKVFHKHVYGAYPDPEGLLSTLPAIGSVLLGILVGYWLRTARPAMERCAGLLAMGVIVTCIGVLLDWWLMPINKQIWTPAFTVFTVGLGMLTLGAIYWMVDVRSKRWWTLPFVIYGMNAIAAFVAAGLVARLLGIVQISWHGKHVAMGSWMRDGAADGVHRLSAWWVSLNPHFAAFDSQGMTSLAGALAFVLLIFLMMSVLYLFKIFIKV